MDKIEEAAATLQDPGFTSTVPMIMVPTYVFGDEWILNGYWILDTGWILDGY